MRIPEKLLPQAWYSAGSRAQGLQVDEEAKGCCRWVLSQPCAAITAGTFTALRWYHGTLAQNTAAATPPDWTDTGGTLQQGAIDVEKRSILIRAATTLNALATLVPPGVQTRMLKVLLFPPDEDAPRVVETECEIYTDEDVNQGEETHEVRIGTTLLGTSTVTAIPIGPIAFSADSSNGSGPPTRLYLAFDASIQGPTSSQPLNRAALRINDDGQPHRPWWGPLVGFRAREPVRTNRQFVDVGPQDVAAFATGLNSRAPPPHFLTWREMPPDEVLEDIMRPAGRAVLHRLVLVSDVGILVGNPMLDLSKDHDQNAGLREFRLSGATGTTTTSSAR
ncbi:hypothetical protein C8Q70DRAFT_932529 [Cubamyces menziesii]|nr:hypothetical protein C8Q70DRAFT_932529 [Cubamyces menziesii]